MPTDAINGRGRKSVAREEPDDEDEPKVEDVGFARPCTWKADSPCWLRDELPEWNRLLAKNFFELQEHSWSEFKFTGYLWSQIDMPEEGATLRVSLLINFLLRHHRCLTRVSVDFAVSELEHEIFWDGIKNGAAAVTFLEYKGTMAQHEGLAPREEYHLWAQSLLSLTNLHSLYLSRVFIDLKVCELLSDFMEDTTTLVTLSLKKIKPEEKVVGCLLEAFTMNKTIKNFYVRVLLDLTFYNCSLDATFATAAANALAKDSRLRTLELQNNPIPITGCTEMIEALKVNKSLATLSFNVTGMPAANLMAPFFQAIDDCNAASRLKISWVQPRGPDFAKGVEKCSDLTLRVNLSENDGIDLIRSLERNKTVQVLTLSEFLFRKRAVRALGQLVTNNRHINELTVTIREGASEWNQMKSACRELKEAILSNRTLTVLNVELITVNLASDFAIKDTLRRNVMYVNEAVYFVKGSNERSHAAAFEALKKSYSLKKAVKRTFSMTDDQALAKIEDAHKRFAANFFMLTGVVKERVRCEPNPNGLATLEECDVRVLTHLCRFINLNDVLQV
ncbi:hypothetical protein HPB52_007248 [Rhipicephalus sanguineus]|uniref:Ran gtpase-activating protein n=1 Tax=Rhipicephalus sanguineus TaxID=34632 RepID=A0A9D4QCY8_RHISA|nr:hypothetical protein HPB52_007248 [Rhipicephalus sanguineus]